MNMAKYCKEKGMSHEEYLTYKCKVENMAKKAFRVIKNNYPTDTGMYYNTEDILPLMGDKDRLFERGYAIQKLKTMGVEFRENNSLWRY